MKNTIKVTLVKFTDNISTDLTAYNRLTPNAQKVYHLFNNCAHTHNQQLIEFDIIETSKNMEITPAEFIDAIDEINNQEYFMYYKDSEDKYVFANSRMVY